MTTNVDRHARGEPCTVDAAHFLARCCREIGARFGHMLEPANLAALYNATGWPGLSPDGRAMAYSSTELAVIQAGAKLDLGLIGGAHGST